MSEKPATTPPSPVTARPPRVSLAAAVTGAQGLVVAVVGILMLATVAAGESDGVRQATTGAVTMLLLSVLPLAAGHGLWRLRRWSRGPAVVVQILALPVSWNLFATGGLWRLSGIVLAGSAVVVLGALMSAEVAKALGVGPREPEPSTVDHRL